MQDQRFVKIRSAERDRNNWHDDFFDQWLHEARESSAHNKTNGNCKQISFVDEIAKFFEETSKANILHTSQG